jgi:hypothetical protein
LSIGETIEEVQDTGFLSAAPTLAVQQISANALLQVHPQEIRHFIADRRVKRMEGATRQDYRHCDDQQAQGFGCSELC